ncbi:MAG TPA: 50S ribosomal protein L29 [Thermoleophilia bacterium]|nr:50S ribosomal protein L29 [Thermoleophilia bacterium]
MKVNEINEMDGQELEQLLKQNREELFNLRFQHATGQLENTARLKQVRRDIARILTVKSYKEKEQ